MSFKEILKPNLKNLALSILLILIFVPFINHDNGIRCITAPCPSDTTSSIIGYLFSEYKTVYQINYIFLLIGIILSYLVSCFIINYFKK